MLMRQWQEQGCCGLELGAELLPRYVVCVRLGQAEREGHLGAFSGREPHWHGVGQAAVLTGSGGVSTIRASRPKRRFGTPS